MVITSVNSISNVQGTGFNSISNASKALGQNSVKASTPTQIERSLRSDNRELSTKNDRLQSENNTLYRENSKLQVENTSLSKEVSQLSSANNDIYKPSKQAETRSETKAKSADEVVTKQEQSQAAASKEYVAANNPTASPSISSYINNLSGIDVGSAVNSFV